MAVVINGTTGITNPNGSAGAPVFTGQGSNTGLYFPSNTSAGIATAGLGRVIVDANGYVTQPYQPSFRAYATSSQSPGPGAVIVFNNDSATGMFNTGSHYNTSNGRFTAPVTGVYAFSFSVLYQSCPNGQYGDTSIYRNGSTMINTNRLQYQSTYTGYGGYLEARSSVVIKLTAGDYVTINNGSASTQSLYVNDPSWTWFSGWLLG